MPPEWDTELDAIAADVKPWYERVVKASYDPATGQVTVTKDQELELQAILRTHISRVFADGFSIGAEAAGEELTAQVLAHLPKPGQFAFERATLSVTRIGNTLSNFVRGTVRRSLDEGLQPVEIQAIIEEMAPELGTWKAEQIAITEYAYATNKARMATYREVGVETVHWWCDPRLNNCPLCLHMQSKGEIFLGNYFSVAGSGFEYQDEDGNVVHETFTEDITEPPLHMNCGCEIRPGPPKG